MSDVASINWIDSHSNKLNDQTLSNGDLESTMYRLNSTQRPIITSK